MYVPIDEWRSFYFPGAIAFGNLGGSLTVAVQDRDGVTYYRFTFEARPCPPARPGDWPGGAYWAPRIVGTVSAVPAGFRWKPASSTPLGVVVERFATTPFGVVIER